MPDSLNVFDVIATTRAMRRLKPDPIPDALVKQILEAGLCAPNGGNHQTWRFLVVKDLEKKRAVQVHYERAYKALLAIAFNRFVCCLKLAI